MGFFITELHISKKKNRRQLARLFFSGVILRDQMQSSHRLNFGRSRLRFKNIRTFFNLFFDCSISSFTIARRLKFFIEEPSNKQLFSIQRLSLHLGFKNHSYF